MENERKPMYGHAVYKFDFNTKTNTGIVTVRKIVQGACCSKLAEAAANCLTTLRSDEASAEYRLGVHIVAGRYPFVGRHCPFCGKELPSGTELPKVIAQLAFGVEPEEMS